MRHRKYNFGLRSFLITIMMGLTPPVMAQTSLQKTTVAYRNIEGHTILADIYLPKGDALRPVIVWFHGGALIMGNRETILPEIRALAEEKNYAIISFDYRLAPETKLPAIISDVEAAFKWLAIDGANRFHLDLDRMVVAGNSAGGYLALVAGYRANPKPKALVSLYGYGRLNEDWYLRPNLYPEYNPKKITPEEAASQTDGKVVSDSRQRKGNSVSIYFYYRQTGLWPREVSGFSSKSMSTDIAPYEPAKNITQNYPPTLLIHGTEDHDVPYDESANMAAQFEQHGVPYILKSVGKGGHFLDGGDKAQIEDSYKVMREFIVRHLGSN